MSLRSVLSIAIVVAASSAASFPSTVRLNNGLEMPLVSLGTAEYDNSDLEQAIPSAASLGIRGVDTAFNYYNEASVGKGVRKATGERLFVTTKTTPCVHPQARPPYNITDVDACREQTRSDVESNFKQLGMDVVDLLLLHGANHFGPGGCDEHACALNRAQWQIYEEYYAAGRVRAIGVSNFCPSCWDCLLDTGSVVPAINQIKYHVGMGADPELIISQGRRVGIIPMAYTPLGRGELFTDPLLMKIGAAHNKTAAQVALRWIVQKGYPLATASHNPKHLAEDVDLFSWSLGAEDVDKLDGYSKGSDSPSWACTSVSKTVVV